MIQRRNFLGSLVLAFPFGRALASSLPMLARSRIVSDTYTIAFAGTKKSFVITVYANGDMKVTWGDQLLEKVDATHGWFTFTRDFKAECVGIRVKKGVEKTLLIDWVSIVAPIEETEQMPSIPCKKSTREIDLEWWHWKDGIGFQPAEK